MRFEPEGRLEIRGAIDAQGEIGNEIIFTLLDEEIDDTDRGGYTTKDYSVGPQIQAIAVGDVDNDDDNDILAPNLSIFSSEPTDLSCLLWNGTDYDPVVYLDVGNAGRNKSTNLFIVDIDEDGVNEVIYDDQIF